MKPRIVLDTNVVVSYSLRSDSPAGMVFRMAMLRCTALASIETIDELRRVLARSKLDRLASPSTRQSVFDAYAEAVQMCAVTHVVTTAETQATTSSSRSLSAATPT